MHDELAAMAREGPARRADICQRLRALLGRELTREQIVSSKLGTLVNSIRKNPALSVPDDEDDGCRLAEQLLLHWKPVMLGGGRPKDPPPADGPASLPSSPLLDGKRAGGAEADDGTAKRSKPTSALPSPRLITQAEFDEAVRDFCPDHDTRAKSFLMFLKALQVDDDDLDNGDKNDSGPTSNTESSHKESSHKESSNKEPSNKEPSNKGLTPTQASTFTHGSTSTHGSTFPHGSTPAQASGLLRLPDELTLATAHAIEGGLFHACGAEASTQYKQQVRAKYLNLSHRTQGRHLRQALLDGSLKATAFCTMTSQVCLPSHPLSRVSVGDGQRGPQARAAGHARQEPERRPGRQRHAGRDGPIQMWPLPPAPLQVLPAADAQRRRANDDIRDVHKLRESLEVLLTPFIHHTYYLSSSMRAPWLPRPLSHCRWLAAGSSRPW